MFRGRSEHNLDAKCRLSIPVRFKEVLAKKYENEKLVVTNFPSCLVAYPMKEWLALEEEFAKIKFPPPEILAYHRYFLAGGIECALDSQGRILIPANLRQEAGIDREVVLSGMLTHFEIWSKEKLDPELQKVRVNFNEYSRVMANVGSK